MSEGYRVAQRYDLNFRQKARQRDYTSRSATAPEHLCTQDENLSALSTVLRPKASRAEVVLGWWLRFRRSGSSGRLGKGQGRKNSERQQRRSAKIHRRCSERARKRERATGNLALLSSDRDPARHQRVADMRSKIRSIYGPITREGTRIRITHAIPLELWDSPNMTASIARF